MASDPLKKGDSVEITGEVAGLTPGEHGFHIHEFGDASAPDARSAGDHFNPAKMPHGSPIDEKRRVGDFGNIKADQTGRAVVKIIRLSGPRSIVGRSVVVHAGADDLKSQPGRLRSDRHRQSEVPTGEVMWQRKTLAP